MVSSIRRSCGATARARTVARSARLAAVVICVWVVALASAGADASRVLRREGESLQETLATVDTTAGPTVAARDISNASHVFTDEIGDMWHVLDGNHTLPNATAAIATTTPPPTTSSPPAATSGHETHSAQVELQEKMDHAAASNTTTTASSASTAAHHKTPMMGFVVIGAMAIVCVGIAAGVAKRKRDRVGHGDDHH